MYIPGEIYDPNKISNRQLLVYGDGWLTDVGKLALQHAHKAVPAIGRVFKFFYERRKRKQAEAEKNKLKEHLMKMSADVRLRPEDRMKILDLLREIKIEPHKYTNEQFRNLFTKIQNGVNLASMAGLYGIHKYEQNKEHKEEPKDTTGTGFDEIIKLIKKNPEVAHKADKFNKKKGLSLTLEDIEYIKKLFKKHNIYDRNKKQLYTIKNDFFSLTKPSQRHYKLKYIDNQGNILNNNIYEHRGIYNSSINGIPSAYDEQISSPIQLLSKLYESNLYNNEKMIKNMENIKDLHKENNVLLYNMMDNKPIDSIDVDKNTTSEGEYKVILPDKSNNNVTGTVIEDYDESVDETNRENAIKKGFSNTDPYKDYILLKNNLPNFNEYQKNYNGPKLNDKAGRQKFIEWLSEKSEFKNYTNENINENINEIRRSSSVKRSKKEIEINKFIRENTENNILPTDTQDYILKFLDTIEEDDNENLGPRFVEYLVKKIKNTPQIQAKGLSKKGGRIHITPLNFIRNGHGYQSVMTLPFSLNNDKHIHKHIPSMFNENHKGVGFLEAY